MCLIFVAWDHHPHYPLVVAANRDEFLERPSAPAGWWDDAPEVLAGRDLRGGGTWMGITSNGRFAAVTNYRDPSSNRDDAPSRGALVSTFLEGTLAPCRYLEQVAREGARYNGFNLLCAVPGELAYYSNRVAGVRRLEPGLHGVSNHLLDTPWPKVARGKRAVDGILASAGPDQDRLMQVLANREQAADADLPDTGIGLEWERALSPLFIRTPDYGTRSTTVLTVDRAGRVDFVERTYPPVDDVATDVRFSFDCRPWACGRHAAAGVH